MAYKQKGFPEHSVKSKTPSKIPHGYKVEGEEGHHAFRSDLSFKKAFRVARDAGVKTFTWRGKSYTTKVK